MNKHWEVKRLGEVCTLQRGFDLPKHSRSAGSFPLVSSSGIIDTHNLWKVKAPGVVTGRSGSIGNVFYIVDDFWPLNTVLYIKDFHGNDPRYIYYLLTQFDLGKYSSGMGVPTLNRNNVHDVVVSIPKSLPEQQRIVGILDEAFTTIATAKENAEKNLQNARELFESYLQNVFANSGDRWEEKKLGQIATVEYGFTDKAKNEGDFRFIRITDIDKSGCLIKEDKKYIKFSKEAEEFVLNDNDLLMARTGATFAKVLLYKNIEKSVFASYLIRINFTEDMLNELYWYFSKTKLYWDQANKLSSGSAQPQFNGAALKEVVFPFPRLITEQRAIVAKLNALSVETKKLEALYQQKLNDLDELKKSVLQKAFNWEL